MDVTHLPFNAHLGIERHEGSLRLPAGERFENHLGTVHAGALMALAEAASGDALVGAIGDLAERVLPVVRRFECKFRRPVVGEVSAHANLPDGAVDLLRQTLEAKGRASVEIDVNVVDSEHATAMSAKVEWFVAIA